MYDFFIVGQPDYPVDIFAFGVIMWEMLANHELYAGLDGPTIANKVSLAPMPCAIHITQGKVLTGSDTSLGKQQACAYHAHHPAASTPPLHLQPLVLD